MGGELEQVTRKRAANIGLRGGYIAGDAYEIRDLLHLPSFPAERSLVGPFDLEVTASTGSYFDVVSNELHWRHVRAQRTLSDSRRDRSMATAWRVVTAYYSSFFHAHAIMCVGGYWIVNLTAEDCGLIRSLSANPHNHPLEPGEYVGEATAAPDGITVRFRSRKLRTHQLCWQLMLQYCQSHASPDVPWQRFQALLSSKDGFSAPSDTRNLWNYRHPRWFGADGDSIAAKFDALLNNPDGAAKWIARHPETGDARNVNALAFLATYMEGATRGITTALDLAPFVP